MDKTKVSIVVAGMILVVNCSTQGQINRRRKLFRPRPTATGNPNISSPTLQGNNPSQFGADMMEGNNIRRKGRGRNKFTPANSQTSPAVLGATTTAPGHATIGNRKPARFGADLLDGQNIRRKGNGRNKFTPLNSQTSPPALGATTTAQGQAEIRRKKPCTFGADLVDGCNIRRKHPRGRRGR